MIELYVSLALLLVGLVVGRIAEILHYRRIRSREQAWETVETHGTRHLPEGLQVARSALATGSAVISVDYFKRFAASLKKLFGGEVRAYASLIDRARREALLRMKESQPDADLFINVRIETSTIGGGTENAMGAVEVLAYGTAIWRRP